jgi:hypothetical protein
MPAFSVFRWIEGRGWIVLSGGPDRAGELRGQALARAAADGAVACVTLSGDLAEADHLLDDIEDLGAPSGYIVDLISEDDATVLSKLAEASVIVITDAPNVDTARSMLTGAALEGIRNAHANGAVILVEANAIGVFGMWLLLEDGSKALGFDWLHNALIMLNLPETSERTRIFLEEYTAGIVVAIGSGSALALGPDGQVETWGRGEVTVALGSQFLAKG